MNLEQIQRSFFAVVRQPLTPSQGMRPRQPDGALTRRVANAIIKPNNRLTAPERLEIYNQQYWFRILDCLTEDFPGLRSLLGKRKFSKLALAYLTECPSESFTLRNLGSRLEPWLRRHPAYAPGVQRLAVDMVRLEWAEIHAFDEAELPRYSADEVGKLSGDTVFRLQPHLQLLDLAYPVDEWLFAMRRTESGSNMASNAVLEFPTRKKIQRAALPKPQKVYLGVYRLQNTVYFKRLTRDAFRLVQALGQGTPLARAIESSLPRSPQKLALYPGQIREWFENWSMLGWLAKL